LETDPARRFQDVAQLAMVLAPFGGPRSRGRALGVARVLSMDATRSRRIPVYADAVPRAEAAMRKVIPPRPRPQAGSDDDIGGSRL